MRATMNLRLDSCDNEAFSNGWHTRTLRNLEVTPNSTITDLIGMQRQALSFLPQDNPLVSTWQSNLRSHSLDQPQQASSLINEPENQHPPNRSVTHKIKTGGPSGRSLDERQEAELERRINCLRQKGQEVTEEAILAIYKWMSGGQGLTPSELREFIDRRDIFISARPSDRGVIGMPCDRPDGTNQPPLTSPVLDSDHGSIYEPSNEPSPSIPAPVKLQYIPLPKATVQTNSVSKLRSRVKRELSRSRSYSRSGRTRKYNMLTTQQKQHIVQQCFYLSVNEVARIYGISINNICRWRKRCERKSGAGRKVHDPAMENELLRWIDQMGGTVVVTRQLIRRKAIELSRDDSFKASKGWFERFMNRNRELIRRSGYSSKGSKLKMKTKEEGDSSYEFKVKLEE